MKRTLLDKIERSINAYDKAMAESNGNIDFARNEAFGSAYIDLMNDAGIQNFTDVPAIFSRKADMIVNVAIGFPR